MNPIYCWEEDLDGERSTLTNDGVEMGASWRVVYRTGGVVAIRPTKLLAQAALNAYHTQAMTDRLKAESK
jgi:hypothetical protein